MGPLEYCVIGFEGNKFNGEIMPELKALQGNGTIHILDLLFVTREGAGAWRVLEMHELTDEQAKAIGPIDYDESGWFSREDVDKIGAALPENSSVAMLLLEHSWATHLKETIQRANGELLVSERIPVRLVEAVEAEKLATAQAGTR